MEDALKEANTVNQTRPSLPIAKGTTLIDIATVEAYAKALDNLSDVHPMDIGGFVIGISDQQGKAFVAGGGNPEIVTALLQRLEENVSHESNEAKDCEAPNPESILGGETVAMLRNLGYEVVVVDDAGLAAKLTSASRAAQEGTDAPEMVETVPVPTAIPLTPRISGALDNLYQFFPKLPSEALVTLHNKVARELEQRDRARR